MLFFLFLNSKIHDDTKLAKTYRILYHIPCLMAFMEVDGHVDQHEPKIINQKDQQ